jgi:hypothetical protein
MVERNENAARAERRGHTERAITGRGCSQVRCGFVRGGQVAYTPGGFVPPSIPLESIDKRLTDRTFRG